MNAALKIKIFGQDGTQVLQLSKSSLTLGSAAHCDVVSAHASVNPEHARAWLDGGRIWVQDLGSAAGTSLNEIRLPALKPMLLRDLDVLRLGQSDATIVLEPVVVRAPTMKAAPPQRPAPPQPTSKETPPDPVKEIEFEKRREQLHALGRELADTRLQLQMARLEANSADEMSKQLHFLREEIKTVQEQKVKWNETLRQLELDKQQLRQDAEMEIAKFKQRHTPALSIPLVSAAPMVEVPTETFEPPAKPSANSKTGQRPRIRPQWKGLGISSVVFATVMISGGWLILHHSGKPTASRTLSSREVEPRPAAPVEQKPKVAGHFSPKQGSKYRANYSDNVLYLENYVGAEQNPGWRNLWQAELNKVAVGDWKIANFPTVDVVTKEKSLINDLVQIKDTIATDQVQKGVDEMRAREAKFMHELDGLLKGPAGVERFLKFKHSFYSRNQIYLTR